MTRNPTPTSFFGVPSGAPRPLSGGPPAQGAVVVDLGGNGGHGYQGGGVMSAGQGPEPRPRGRPRVIRDNGDGTVDVDGETMDTAEAEILVRGDGKALGKGLSDCAWCRYGKPAVAGAVIGLGLAAVSGMEPTRGLVWGGVGGLLYGQLRG